MYTLSFDKISLKSLPDVGGKNSSLGEMFNSLRSKGVNVPDGFATTSDAYKEFVKENNLEPYIKEQLDKLDRQNFTNLNKIGCNIRTAFSNAKLPDELKQAIKNQYDLIFQKYGRAEVAVRSSATAEDLPDASFAGQLESFLNISGEEQLYEACRRCFASLYTDRGIKYRIDKGYDKSDISVSVGFQIMVRTDEGCSGVAFTLDPDSGFKNVVVIDGCWGLGENIVQGRVTPDEFIVFKPSLDKNLNPIINKKLGAKEKTMIFSGKSNNILGETVLNIDTTEDKKKEFTLNDEEIKKLARWSVEIEKHYKKPMDIEWAKDGISNELFIVQARPETVHSLKEKTVEIKTYELKSKTKILTSGIAIGEKISSGKAKILSSASEANKVEQGDIVVTDITNPDWDPIMMKASAIITNKGGRTSHAAIVARELGLVAVVGTGNATESIKNEQEVTVSCIEGKKGNVYEGLLKWEEKVINISDIKMPSTQVMLILGDPDKAFKHSFLPNNGIGLMRLEFIINNYVKIHPLALINYDSLKDSEAKKNINELTAGYKDKKQYFIDKLSQGVATIAAAFYPKDVIVRFSDFKSNEYANLIGGKEFEPHEENPMLGFRGASRYYNEIYREGFMLECSAMKKVREEMGFYNVKLMIPFCRTVEEGEKVVELMSDFGLLRRKNHLEIYVMIEIPSNVILADEFAKIFDGFSIGSNDLTQLTLGVDRDSTLVSTIFDEENEAVKTLIRQVIQVAKHNKVKIGLCGQAPSDLPDFAKFLVDQHIDSISFNPDALIKGIKNINAAETGRSTHTSIF